MKNQEEEKEEGVNFYQNLAKNLVFQARGQKVLPDGFWEKENNDLASGDDITCITIDIDNVNALLHLNSCDTNRFESMC